MPLAVKASKEVKDQKCDICGKMRKRLIEVILFKDEKVTACNEWSKGKKNCFWERFPFGIIECG